MVYCETYFVVLRILFLLLYVGSRQLMPPDICSLQPDCSKLSFTSQETLAVKSRTIGRQMAGNLAESSDFHATLGNLLHAANVKDTSLPKEGVLSILSP